MYDPTGHLPGAVPSRVLIALWGETKRLDAPAVTGAQVAAPTVTHTLTLHVDTTAAADAVRAALKGGGPLRRPERGTFLPEHPSPRPGETMIYDRAGKLVRHITPDAARSAPKPVVIRLNGNTEAAPADLATAPSPERRTLLVVPTDVDDVSRAAICAQRRAEDALNLLACEFDTGPQGNGAAHAQRMAVATHAAAQALLSAYVLWRAEAEAGGHGVPVPPLAPLHDAERGA